VRPALDFKIIRLTRVRFEFETPGLKTDLAGSDHATAVDIDFNFFLYCPVNKPTKFYRIT
jgi:hypothetical protein